MLSPAKAITAGALVFALGGAFLVAQPFQQPGSAPGAEGDEAPTVSSPPAIVTGSVMMRGDMTQEPTNLEGDGVNQSRGFVREGDRLEMDDPRLSGTMTIATDVDTYMVDDEGASLQAVAQLIENEEGSWSGTCRSLVGVPPGGDSYTESCLLAGADAYEGLSAYLVTVLSRQGAPRVDGLIFEGDVPPFPELPSAE